MNRAEPRPTIGITVKRRKEQSNRSARHWGRCWSRTGSRVAIRAFNTYLHEWCRFPPLPAVTAEIDVAIGEWNALSKKVQGLIDEVTFVLRMSSREILHAHGW